MMKHLIPALCLALSSPTPSAAAPLIAELLAANEQGIKDENGDSSDWIEILNPDDTSITLNGWKLTDDPTQPSKWTFPDVTLMAGERLLVFASGKDRNIAGDELHTNFSLKDKGEYLALINPSGAILSEFNPFPEQKTDVSYGLKSNTQTHINRDSPLAYVLSPPAHDPQGDAWTEVEFDDSTWVNESIPQTGFNSTASVNILDYQSTTSNIPVNGLSGTIQDINITLNISHSFVGDLRVLLKAPDGSSINLISRRGGSGDNFTNTILDDQASNTITSTSSTSAPFTASYRPESPLNTLNGSVPNGTWQLEIHDEASGDTGTLNAWSIDFTTSASNQPTRGAIGYDSSNEYEIDTQLPHGTSEVWIRYPFTLDAAHTLESLTLRTKHDDGFQAYLNGTLIHQTNASAPVQSIEALTEFTDVDITGHLSLLNTGNNVLCFRLLNASHTSSDLLLHPELISSSHSTSYCYSTTPTPGIANINQSFQGFVADTKFFFGRGFFSSAFSETLSCSTPGATLVYTTDGSNPTLSNGTRITAADANTPPSTEIPISRTIPIRAAAFKTNFIPTNTDTNTYIFPSDVKDQSNSITQNTYGLPPSWNGINPDYGMDTDVIGPGDLFSGVYTNTIENNLIDVPTLSIVLPQEDLFGSEGIYSHPTESGTAWERATSFELINPDGTKGFQENCGLRIQGGAFRSFSLTRKKSFRVVFKKEYGAGKLDYDFFGHGAVKKFNSLVLRMMSNDGWNYSAIPSDALFVRDEFGRRIQNDLGQPSSRGNWMHLYINGVYWGLYHPVERPDSSFAESHFNLPEQEWDGINSGTATNSSDDPDRSTRALSAWNTMVSLADNIRTASGTAAKHSAFMKLQGLNPDGSNNTAFEDYLDIPNFIDYLIINHYGANRDWPFKNYYCGRHNNPMSSGFKFFLWDYEWTLDYDEASRGNGRASVTHNNITDYRGVATPYGDLIHSEAFNILFADRIHRALFNDGPLAATAPSTLFTELTDTVRSPLVGESARWGDQHTATPITVNAEWQDNVNSMLANWLPNRRDNLLAQYRAAGRYPNTNAPVFNQHGGSIHSGFLLTISNPNASGTIYFSTNGLDPLLINSDGSFAISPSAQIYTSAETLTTNSTVKARILDNGEWSALNEATFTLGSTPSSTNLVISEFSYQPGESAPDAKDGDDFEFIEIMNVGTSDIDLSSLEFDLGVTFDFSSTPVSKRTLAVGTRAVIVEDINAFKSRYNNSASILGQWSGKLSNSGETLRLRVKDGNTIQEFTYNDKLPWPECADGIGYSLVLINPESIPNHSTPENWRCSVQNHGTPGSGDTLPSFTGNADDDNDLDGLPALVEHFLGSSDSDPTSGNDLLSYGFIDVGDTTITRHPTLTFRKKIGQDDLGAQVEVSSTLEPGSWQTGNSHVLLVSQIHHGNGTITEVWRSVAPVTSQQKQFIRLKVLWTGP